MLLIFEHIIVITNQGTKSNIISFCAITLSTYLLSRKSNNISFCTISFSTYSLKRIVTIFLFMEKDNILFFCHIFVLTNHITKSNIITFYTFTFSMYSLSRKIHIITLNNYSIASKM